VKININTILIVLGFILFYFFISSPKVVKNKTVKEIETRIQDSIVYVDRIKEVVRVDKQEIDKLVYKLDTVTDTVKIIEIQKVIIYKQDTVIRKQDTIINTKQNIILAKDTIIEAKKSKIKKKNKDIIKLTLVAIGATAISILK